MVQRVSNNQVTEGTADRGSVSRLQFSGSQAAGVSIKICIEEGGIVIYGSYTNPNPGPALHDFMEELRDATGSQCLITHIDQGTIMEPQTCSSCDYDNRSRKKRQVEDVEVTVYIAIEGSVDGSSFTVSNGDGRALVGKY